MELNRIYNRDCLEGMRELPDESVDLIVADPPYNIGKDSWDKWKRVEDYNEFMTKVFKECERVLKSTGSFYWFHSDFAQMARLQEQIRKYTSFVFKSLITVDKTDNNYIKDLYGAQNHFRNYLNLAEYILFYTFQDETGLEVVHDKHIKPRHPFAQYLREEFKRAGVSRKEIAALFPSKTGRLTGCVSNWLNGDNVITREQYLKIREYLNSKYGSKSDFLRNEYDDLRKEYDFLRKEYDDLRKEYESLRYKFNKRDGLKNVWSYSFRSEKRFGHPTQKPVKLIADIVRYSSDPGDIVFDPFMGSGTTAVACITTGRNYIGFEIEPKYIEIAERRLSEIDGKGARPWSTKGPHKGSVTKTESTAKNDGRG